jgi:hypothetical protein
MGAPRTTDKIIDFLTEHANINVTLTEIMQVTGLTKSQVQNGIGTLKNRNNLNIETKLAGQVWIYSPVNPATTSEEKVVTPQVFELVGNAKAGLIIQDEDGKLYRAEEL